MMKIELNVNAEFSEVYKEEYCDLKDEINCLSKTIGEKVRHLKKQQNTYVKKLHIYNNKYGLYHTGKT